MLETLGRVLIFFSLIGLGALLVKTRRLTSGGLDGLSAYFYWLGFPAFLISSLSQMPRPDPGMTGWVGIYGLGMILTGLTTFGIARVTKVIPPDAAGAAMASGINNSAFLGFPLALSLFGASAAKIGPVLLAVDFLLLFGLGCAGIAYTSGNRMTAALKRVATNPTVISSFAGVLLMMFQVRFPAPLQSGLDLIGHSGPPVALVALGGLLGLLPKGTLTRFNRAAVIATAAKTLLAPALVAGGLYLIGADPEIFRVAVLLAACPTAVSVFIQTRLYDVWFEGAGITIAQTTLFSLFTLCALALILTPL